MDYELPIPPERIAELAEPLGEEAREILGKMLEAAALPPGQRPEPDELLEGFDELSGADKDQLLRINTELLEGYSRRDEEYEGMGSFVRQAMRIVERAQELDPQFKARGDNVTVGQAVEVLEAHGEKLGISREALDTTLMVPVVEVEE